MNLSSNINAIIPVFRAKLGFFILLIRIKTQKIDGFTLKTYGIIIVRF